MFVYLGRTSERAVTAGCDLEDALTIMLITIRALAREHLRQEKWAWELTIKLVDCSHLVYHTCPRIHICFGVDLNCARADPLARYTGKMLGLRCTRRLQSASKGN